MHALAGLVTGVVVQSAAHGFDFKEIGIGSATGAIVGTVIASPNLSDKPSTYVVTTSSLLHTTHFGVNDHRKSMVPHDVQWLRDPTTDVLIC